MQRPIMLYTAILRKPCEEITATVGLNVSEHEAEAFPGAIQR